MISVYLECSPEVKDTLIAELWERGTLGVIELPSGVRAWFETLGGLDDLIDRYDGDLLAEPEEDWEERTRRSFPPLAIGERFWLTPPWNTDATPPGRLRLEINPGQACGTGWHPCTQLCLEAMERHLSRGAAVLDVGTGSGILTEAARLLGAGLGIACDIDMDAASIARDRLGGSVFAGSADAARTDVFDVIVANISLPVIREILPELGRASAPGGRLILSGFREDGQLEGVVETKERDGWRCLVVHRARNRV
jgi:ribosomal protein L11 methyltransferase